MGSIRRRVLLGESGRHGNVVPTYRPKDDDAASSLPDANDVVGREGITIPSSPPLCREKEGSDGAGSDGQIIRLWRGWPLIEYFDEEVATFPRVVPISGIHLRRIR